MPPSVRGIVEKLKGTKRIYLHYARNQCPNKGNAVIEREKQMIFIKAFSAVLIRELEGFPVTLFEATIENHVGF